MLRVRPQPKSVNFHDAEHRQEPCRTTCKRSLECLFGLWVTKLNPSIDLPPRVEAGHLRRSMSACGGIDTTDEMCSKYDVS
ncbi:hypothetical protein TNCV_4537301 [Trichonephila clavipes]|nr:hypothetical protein TNCV_4537301 [Trichonephila clavipes]